MEAGVPQSEKFVGFRSMENRKPSIRFHDIRWERRNQPRIQEAFPALVRGTDENGEAFEEQTVLEDLSSTGLRARLRRFVPTGSKVRVTIQLSRAPIGTLTRPRVEARGRVIRSERKGAESRVAVAIERHKFL